MTRELVDLESITENEKQVGEYLLHYLSGLAAGSDGKVEAMPVTPERFNVYAEWGAPVVVLSTHMDTVPPSSRPARTTKTFTGAARATPRESSPR